MARHNYQHTLLMRIGRWKSDIHWTLHELKQSGMEEITGQYAHDCHAVVRDLRDMADRIEGMAKDYGRDAA